MNQGGGGEEGVHGADVSPRLLSLGHDPAPGFGNLAINIENSAFKACRQLSGQPGSQTVPALPRWKQFNSTTDLGQ